jgi:uncharacterized protein YjbI with pentapeptide repeats
MEVKLIGSKIAEARKKLNVSQAQLAQHLFISPQAVGKWERGESLPDLITLNRLAKITGTDLNYFSEDFPSVSRAGSSVDVPENGTADTSPARQKKTPGWDMSRGNWQDADFSGLKNLKEKFSSSNLQRCLFTGSDLSGLLLKTNHIDRCNFSGSDISNSRIEHSYLNNSNFKECVLNETEFSGSYINGCDFTGADFTGVVIKSGGISGGAAKPGNPGKNTMTGTVWNRTSFKDTQIADIVFEGMLEDCSFENCTFTRVSFRNATLINTFFKNKSLKKIRFIDCCADRITYAFLKNGKANLDGITMLPE